MQEHSASDSLWFQRFTGNEVINGSQAHTKHSRSHLLIYQELMELLSVLLFVGYMHLATLMRIRARAHAKRSNTWVFFLRRELLLGLTGLTAREVAASGHQHLQIIFRKVWFPVCGPDQGGHLLVMRTVIDSAPPYLVNQVR